MNTFQYLVSDLLVSTPALYLSVFVFNFCIECAFSIQLTVSHLQVGDRNWRQSLFKLAYKLW